MAAGFISHVGRQVGGLANPPPAGTPAGWRSHYGFWFGGLCTDGGTPPTPVQVTGDGYLPPKALREWESWLRRQKRSKPLGERRREDREKLQRDIARAFAIGVEQEPALVEAVKPHVQESGTGINWFSVLGDLSALEAIIRASEAAAERRREDETEIEMLLGMM